MSFKNLIKSVADFEIFPSSTNPKWTFARGVMGLVGFAGSFATMFFFLGASAIYGVNALVAALSR